MQIGTNLKKVRSERGLTQEALAAAVGVSRYTVTYLESGEYQPSLELAYRLALFLNQPIENLFPIMHTDETAE